MNAQEELREKLFDSVRGMVLKKYTSDPQFAEWIAGKMGEALGIAARFTPNLPSGDIEDVYDLLASKRAIDTLDEEFTLKGAVDKDEFYDLYDSWLDRIDEYKRESRATRKLFIDTYLNAPKKEIVVDFSTSKEKAIKKIQELNYGDIFVLQSCKNAHKYNWILSRFSLTESPISFHNFLPISDLFGDVDFLKILHGSMLKIDRIRDYYHLGSIFKVGDRSFLHYQPQTMNLLFRNVETRLTMDKIADFEIKDNAFVYFYNPFLAQLGIEFQKYTQTTPEFVAIVGAVKVGHEPEVFGHTTGAQNA